MNHGAAGFTVPLCNKVFCTREGAIFYLSKLNKKREEKVPVLIGKWEKYQISSYSHGSIELN